MAAIIFLLLPLTVMLVLIVMACAVLEVALAGPHPVGGTLATARRWQPPFAQGNALLSWAAAAAASGARRLVRTVSRGTARQLASETYAGIAYAIGRLPGQPIQRSSACASCRHQMIGVTAPEALTIADAICDQRSHADVERIRDRAAQSAAAIEKLDRRQYERARFTCPLFLGDRGCAVYEARPIHCRGWRGCAPSAAALEEPEQAGQADMQAQTIAQGAEAGLSRALNSAGLDGAVYELNSALIVALDTPNAAARWAKKLPVFESCKHYG